MPVNPEKINIGFLIYTYNKVDDAKINMEIIRSIWHNSRLFQNIIIIHAYNGDRSWYPAKYLEDELITLQNVGHFRGASDLIDAGMKAFEERHRDTAYVIVIAPDTWLTKPSHIAEMLKNMRNNHLYLATCAWSSGESTNIFEDGVAVDFFIVDLDWVISNRVFPIDYEGFRSKYGELLLYLRGEIVEVESLLLSRFVAAVYNEEQDDVALKHRALSRMHRMRDREPIHTGIDERGVWIRKRHWPEMGLVAYDQPDLKQQALKDLEGAEGENIQRLLNTNDLSYYNKPSASALKS